MRKHIHPASPSGTAACLSDAPDGTEPARRFGAYRFELYAQPIVTSAGSLAAAELLVRPATPPEGASAAPVLAAARRLSATVALDRQAAAYAADLARRHQAWQWSANLSPAGVRDVVRRSAAPPAGVWWELSEQIRPDQVPASWVLSCRRAPGRLAADDVADPEVAAAWVERGVDIVKFDRRVLSDPGLLDALLAACSSATVVLEGATRAQLDAATAQAGHQVLGQSFSLAPPVPLSTLEGAVPARLRADTDGDRTSARACREIP